jgi:uncharacterized protein (TIGR02145 family)
MVLFVAACGQDAIAQPATAVTDARDGREYSIVEIAGMSWFARNLADEAPVSSCPNGTASECATTGRLYPWELAVRACPSRSHLATEDEWQLLELSLGTSDYSLSVPCVLTGP